MVCRGEKKKKNHFFLKYICEDVVALQRTLVLMEVAIGLKVTANS